MTSAMSLGVFSPTLTASSSSTAAQSISNDLDMTVDKGMEDFSEMFNFDEFESSVSVPSAIHWRRGLIG